MSVDPVHSSLNKSSKTLSLDFTSPWNCLKVFGLPLGFGRYGVFDDIHRKLEMWFACSYLDGPQRSWPQWPQVSPMGPKKFRQKFSHMILIGCYLVHFWDLFCKKLWKLWKTWYFRLVAYLVAEYEKYHVFQGFHNFLQNKSQKLTK